MSSVLLIGVLALGFADEEAANQRRIDLEQQQDQETLAKWLEDSPPAQVKFVSPARYPESTQLIEKYVLAKTQKDHKVQSIAFIMENHTPSFIYGRIFRAKFNGKDGKEYVIDFLMQKKKTAYFSVDAWQMATDVPAVAASGG